jgi:hypothetical protein
MTSNIAGQAFQFTYFPPSSPIGNSPVFGSRKNLSAFLYQSGMVLIIGAGLFIESLDKPFL